MAKAVARAGLQGKLVMDLRAGRLEFIVADPAQASGGEANPWDEEWADDDKAS